MRHILTEEEFQTLQKQARSRLDLGLTPDESQTFCAKVAGGMPINRSGCLEKRSPWGCILTSTTEYCDACPARNINPHLQELTADLILKRLFEWFPPPVIEQNQWDEANLSKPDASSSHSPEKHAT